MSVVGWWVCTGAATSPQIKPFDGLSERFEALSVDEVLQHSPAPFADTESPTIRIMRHFMHILGNSRIARQRWGLGLSWTTYLRRELAHGDIGQEDNALSNRHFTFVMMDALLNSLKEEDNKKALKVSDYDFLIGSGFSDFAVEVAYGPGRKKGGGEDERKHSKRAYPNVMALLSIAVARDEEAFVRELFARRRFIPDFSIHTQKILFWYYTCTLEAFDLFNEGAQYLSASQRTKLRKMLLARGSDGSMTKLWVAQRCLEFLSSWEPDPLMA